MFYLFSSPLSDDVHFKTNPKIPGIDLNSVRTLFATLSKPAFSVLLEQVFISLKKKEKKRNQRYDLVKSSIPHSSTENETGFTEKPFCRLCILSKCTK